MGKKAKSKKKKISYTWDHDEAFDKLEFVVQCGDCHVFYGAQDCDGVCPLCGGEEWVGSR